MASGLNQTLRGEVGRENKMGTSLGQDAKSMALPKWLKSVRISQGAEEGNPSPWEGEFREGGGMRSVGRSHRS